MNSPRPEASCRPASLAARAALRPHAALGSREEAR